MIALSKKMFHAVEAVLYIAYNAQADAVSSKEIAEKQGLPPRYLEPMMQKLVKAGVLRGVRGPHGGYLLAKERRRITLGEVYRALADEETLDAVASQATTLGKHVLQPLCEQIQNLLLEQWQQISMAQLCEQAHGKKIRRANEDRASFMI